MSVLELRVLGPPEVRVDGEVRPVRARKALALLGYLALEPGPHARETLAALFWPDSAPEVARSSLRNSLTSLRQALGPASARVVTERDTVRLCLEPGDTLDVQLLEHGQPAAFRGDVLSGLRLEDGEVLGAWLDTQRGRVRALVERMYAASTRALLDSSPSEAAELARRWLALDNLNEEAWRRLIQALLAAGQRGAARDALGTCRAVLRQELGVSPAPETLALAVPLEGVPTGARELPQSPPSLPGFVGRVSELGRLGAVWEAVRCSGVRGALLTGEPGIGKTSLAATFAQEASRAGGRVLRGRAFQARTMTLGVWADLLRSALDGVEPQTLPLPPVWRAELALLPAFARLARVHGRPRLALQCFQTLDTLQREEAIRLPRPLRSGLAALRPQVAAAEDDLEGPLPVSALLERIAQLPTLAWEVEATVAGMCGAVPSGQKVRKVASRALASPCATSLISKPATITFDDPLSPVEDLPVAITLSPSLNSVCVPDAGVM
ncbi:AAA family ATPase [Deinococcus apachensis]|uniref:AAA family ATPase n=1 Tax=Deinococcus apachensis TaxID=309886 RepID=UPI0012FC46D1|nr:AAA family ATPase [Deinococcus apachensis]